MVETSEDFNKSETPHEGPESPTLDLLKQRELELNIRLLKVRRKAEEIVVRAKEEAARRKEEAIVKGEKEGKALYQKEMEKAKKEAEKIRQQASKEVALLEKKAQQNLNKAVKKVIEIITTG